MRIEITGIGWVTAAGKGRGNDYISFSMPHAPLNKISSTPAFDEPYPQFRRMDQYSRLGLTAIALALKDAALAEWTQKRSIGIIASTVYGCLATDIDYYDTVMSEKGIGASPALFSYTLPNSFLGEAAIRFGLTGASFVINEQNALGLDSLQMAVDHIAWGEIEKMLCGVCDLGCPPNFSGPNQFPPGALFFMLEKIRDRKSSSYGKLSLQKTGGILFNRSKINDLADLVQKCITS